MADLSPKDARSTLSFGPELPYQLGRFTLCEELGAGGMATVYLSKMRLAAGLARHVAIKTIHAHLAKQQSFVDMFLDEAKIASHISHPNVCSVYDFGDVQGLYYIAMEYLVGAPLIEVVNAVVDHKNEAMLEEVPYLAARIIADAAEGLHAAHTLRGADGQPLRVIHRDVSPQNLFVTYEGSVKVVDFGCAKALERVTETNTGVMKGKVAYAAPEQLQGKELDARVDVFALGVCLWECLTLRNLFRRGNAILTAQAVLNDDIPLASEGNDWVPEPLAAICAKALHRDKDKRFASAREMGRALRAWIAGSGTMFESAEVADVMEQLFSDRHASTMRRLDALQNVAVSQVGPVSAPALEITSDMVEQPDTVPPPRRKKKKNEALEAATTKLAKTPAPIDEPNVWDINADDDPVVLPTRTGSYVAMVMLLLALIGGGVYGYMFHRAQIFDTLGIALPGESEGPEVGPDPLSEQTTDAVGADDASPRGDHPSGEGAPSGESGEGDPSGEGSAAGEHREPGADSEPGAEIEPGPSGGEATPSSAQSDDDRATDEAASRGSERRRRRREEAAAAAAAATTSTGEADPPAPAASESPETAIVQPSRTLDFSRGTVMVRARSGWAIVEHEGRRLGRTPVRAQLPTGRQTLRILPYGEEPARTQAVEVTWGQTRTVTLELPSRGTEGWENPY